MPDSRLMPGLLGRLADTKDGGRGVFAARPFARGEPLVVFGGTVMTFTELTRLPSPGHVAIQVDEDAYLVSREDGPGDWVNHSCDPNAGLAGQLTLVAMRAIVPGEEITFDYAMSDGSPYDEFTCRCGGPSCRGRVTGRDWGRQDLVRRYAGYFSPYLQRRIDRLGIAVPREEAQWR